ncbi:MAG: glycosyl hydrolase 115 family protein, partial [Bacteroidetes bacterium]|nr:glycosyl hydrolase 115 family protein [Candidatus Cryptobacteroides intestinavium]
MKIFRSVLFIAVCLLAGSAAYAQVTLAENGPDRRAFTIVDSRNVAAICYDSKDAAVVKTAAELLRSDIEKVTDVQPALFDSKDAVSGAKYAIIAGTVGSSAWIDSLIEKEKIDVSAIKGGWERYAVRLVDNPGKGVRKAIVIAGSDRRGTAFGLMSISREIGVSPWWWWLDAPVEHRDALAVNVTDFDSRTPSVKYRGIFINDEDWGILRWAKNNFEKERGNIGPKTYDKVCELILRLQANMLAPAMHEASTAFYQIPENKEIADRYAVIITTSHCEPLLLNTASEWHSDRYGEWNYNTNKERVDSVLKARVMDAAPYENVYTLALRGLHDKAMSGDGDMDARKETMQRALEAQRQILVDVLGKKAEDIPQAFTPYKEVLDVFNRGLELPDDVTIIWPDDNYGYM